MARLCGPPHSPVRSLLPQSGRPRGPIPHPNHDDRQPMHPSPTQPPDRLLHSLHARMERGQPLPGQRPANGQRLRLGHQQNTDSLTLEGTQLLGRNRLGKRENNKYNLYNNVQPTRYACLQSCCKVNNMIQGFARTYHQDKSARSVFKAKRCILLFRNKQALICIGLEEAMSWRSVVTCCKSCSRCFSHISS